MEDVRIILAAIWAALMLTYLLGDVLRIFSGDAAKMTGMVPTNQGMWLGIAVIMVIPIIMIILSLTLSTPWIRWASILTAVFFLGFNLLGLPTYPSAYDKFLIIVGLGLNVLTAWYAWNWV